MSARRQAVVLRLQVSRHVQRTPGRSLEGFWKGLFGRSRGILVVNAFYENVDRAVRDGTKRNVVLEFNPRPAQDMLVACLWSRWISPGEHDLLSFAAITDEPPEQVSAAGHDRCIIPIRP